MTAEHIILIGAMGVGKSSVGRKLAKKLKRPFFDSDQVIEEKTGVDIATIFDYEGESGFRKREEKAIDELCRRQAMVLATGGGAVLTAPTRKLLATCGTVIYLKASVDMLLKRTRHSDHRPLLNVPDKRQVITELLHQREPLYLQTADHTIDTDRRTVSWTANRVLQLLDLTPEP
ncbi:MAG: shikimate kinase [Gammaproteobacteria bacterium]|nr:shikimate kinase [Gammaproteobacteria bacterium]